MTTNFFVFSRVLYRETSKDSGFFLKLVFFFMNVIWLLSFLLSTTIAFLPIIPASLFAPIIEYVRFDMTRLGIIVGSVGVSLYAIFALGGIIAAASSKVFEKKFLYKQVLLFALVLIIPSLLAFALSKVLELGSAAVLMLTGTFTFISYLLATMNYEKLVGDVDSEIYVVAIQFFSQEKNGTLKAAKRKNYLARLEYIEEIASIEYSDVPGQKEAIKHLKYRISGNPRYKLSSIEQQRAENYFYDNEIKIQKQNQKFGEATLKTGKLIIALHLIYILVAIAMIVLIVLSSKREIIAKIWGSFLIYAPTVATILKIISSIVVMFKKKKSKQY